MRDEAGELKRAEQAEQARQEDAHSGCVSFSQPAQAGRHFRLKRFGRLDRTRIQLEHVFTLHTQEEEQEEEEDEARSGSQLAKYLAHYFDFIASRDNVDNATMATCGRSMVASFAVINCMRLFRGHVAWQPATGQAGGAAADEQQQEERTLSAATL